MADENEKDEKQEPRRGRPAKAEEPAVIVQQSAESFKAEQFAKAMADAASMHMDETVPGGAYKNAAGQWVDANGNRINVDGADDANHSGELRGKASVKAVR